MSERLDKPSDIEFAQAIVQNIPEGDTHLLAHLGAAYLASKVLKSAHKKR
jgi:hypothetical protein